MNQRSYLNQNNSVQWIDNMDMHTVSFDNIDQFKYSNPDIQCTLNQS